MIKKFLSLMALSLLVVSCNGKKEASANDETVSTETSTTEKEAESDASFFSSKESLAKAEADLRNLPKFKGKNINVFQDIHFYNDGRITLSLQDPEKPDNIDVYSFKNGVWGEPEPVQISGNGKMEDNVFPLDKFKFETLAAIYYVMSRGSEILADGIDGTREKYEITFNLDGSVKNFEKM